MDPESVPGPDSKKAEGRPTGAVLPGFEDYPLTRQEYISALVHFYRGEMYRSQVWRTRLDTTTNWAVVSTAAMITFTFGEAVHPHIILLLSNLVIAIFLCQEARRFRYFAVYRARVRMIEENFFLPIITRELESPMEAWGRRVALDLDRPTFKTTYPQAVGFRLRRNYLWMFLIIGAAWLVKLFIHPTQAAGIGMIYARMGVGPIPPWIVLAFGLSFWALIFAALVAVHRAGMPVDEIKGLEQDLAHWKI
jgi:uncharacterized membrane protein